MKKLIPNKPYVYYSDVLNECMVATEVVPEKGLESLHDKGWLIEYGGNLAHLNGVKYLHPEFQMLINYSTSDIIHTRFKQIGEL